MKEPKPSLAHRLAWLFPPVGIFVFAFEMEGAKLFDFNEPRNMLGGLAMFAYLVGYAANLARDAISRRQM
jgi:hypothetical protein